MRKLAYCPCGCGGLKRAPLPPKAARLRNKRLADAAREDIRRQIAVAIRNHNLMHGPTAGNA